MINLILVDDHKIVREGIAKLLSGFSDLNVIASVDCGEEALKLVREKSPDVVLMDLKMPGIGGLEATRKLLLRDPKIKIIILTMYTEDPFPAKLLQAGAMGYLSKESDIAEIVSAIRLVVLDKRHISPKIAKHLALKNVLEPTETPFDLLSEREFQVMVKVVNGELPKVIAEQLNLSPKTINTCRYRTFDKLGVSGDIELTHLALRYGLVRSKPVHVKTKIAQATVPQ